ncbi:hypothetical protein EVJ58_g9608 [Rhodofomes roseus]|uniref:Uncharacterized protein n=1 Tax=Rhodofomes roseus TaxID=34475 RepID=A0A4Y9XSX7_9APHY|nr:hypothetical protein EVJ58_g9608 [Rhodofomes roseus]
MFKDGLYEVFKGASVNLAGEEASSKYKGAIWLAGSASAESFADIALCPLEMTKVRTQTSPLGTSPTPIKPFRQFRRQLYHSSMSMILDPLKPYMRKPDILKCWGRHYRRAIYGLGPNLLDYPEQALSAGVVYGWCITCPGDHKNLDEGLSQGRRTREHRELLINSLDEKTLCDDYGIISDIIASSASPHVSSPLPACQGLTVHSLSVMTSHVLTGDILYQLIEGAFMDHQVTWTCQYLVLTYGEQGAKEILDEIDRRIVAMPPFPEFRHFHQGRDVKQWTGDDSKASMKVYLPAIHSLVPPEIVRTISTFSDICYLIRALMQTDDTIAELVEALIKEYHHHREMFRRTGVCPDGFSQPRQHAAGHFSRHIRNFGSMAGLCTSITESKHIDAVKKPWRRSNRYDTLGQMLLTNQRLDKLTAQTSQRVECSKGQHGERRDGLTEAGAETGVRNEEDQDFHTDDIVEGEVVDAFVVLAPRRPASGYRTRSFTDLGAQIACAELPQLVAQFLFWQRHPDYVDEPSDLQLKRYLRRITNGTRVSVFNSVVATFFAPTDAAGSNGMHVIAARAYSGNSCVERVVAWPCRTGQGYFGEYYRYHVPSEPDDDCPCGAPFQTRKHILQDCPRYEPSRYLLRAVSEQVDLPTILGTEKGIAALAKFIERSGAFMKTGEPPANEGEQQEAYEREPEEVPPDEEDGEVGEVEYSDDEDER